MKRNAWLETPADALVIEESLSPMHTRQYAVHKTVLYINSPLFVCYLQNTHIITIKTPFEQCGHLEWIILALYMTRTDAEKHYTTYMNAFGMDNFRLLCELCDQLELTEQIKILNNVRGECTKSFTFANTRRPSSPEHCCVVDCII